MGTFNHLGRALRWLREERGLRQYHLAETATITKAMLSSYETGRQKPSLDTLEKVMQALGCDLHELADTLDAFAGKQRMPRKPSTPESRPPVPASTSGAEVDVYRLLGVSEPMPAGEEVAMRQVLASFHQLMRHFHERFEHFTSNVERAGSQDASEAEEN